MTTYISQTRLIVRTYFQKSKFSTHILSNYTGSITPEVVNVHENFSQKAVITLGVRYLGSCADLYHRLCPSTREIDSNENRS